MKVNSRYLRFYIGTASGNLGMCLEFQEYVQMSNIMFPTCFLCNLVMIVKEK